MSPGSEPGQIPSRFIIGIDLGTTNSSVAYVDTAGPDWLVRDFPIPQVVAPHTIEARLTLPSCHYQAAPGEFAPGALRLDWSKEDPNQVVGFFARDHGAAVPGRLAVSAKSWLCHNGVDRTAGLLPWHGAADVQRLSPVDVSAAILRHIRCAWDHQHPDHPLSRQEVVLTVPASFDEVARQLTVESARQAGLVKLTLAEEPQAAFYAWINAHGGGNKAAYDPFIAAGKTVLVCDIGGGTTDLTLIRVRPTEGGGGVKFHRIAVGQHLLLGGDNLDLTLAQHIEAQLTSGGRLPLHQWGPLLRSARAIKETFLGENPPPRLAVNIASSSAKLIGGGRQVELAADQVQELLLDGFLPSTGLMDRPAAHRSGFQEFNLPYAADPAITRYLAQFLTAHAGGDDVIDSPCTPPAAVPDIVLLNGGFFASPLLRQRLLEVLSSWFTQPGQPPWHPLVLENDRLDLAVSRGAAYYGMVRRGRGVRISGGLAHSYYIAIDRPGAASPVAAALCLLPAGVEEGQEVHLDRPFNLLIRQPVEFGLYLSSTRTTDPPGVLIDVDGEQLTALPPIRTVLQSGRKAAADTVAVSLHAKLSEIGTLELWAAETKGQRQWRLDFDVRSASRAEFAQHTGQAEAQGVLDISILPAAQALIATAFSQPSPAQPVPANPAGLVKGLETLTGLSRGDWPPSLLRNFWEMLLAVPDARRLSVDHEVRWLNLLGFCLRPGYGLAVDDWRVAQTWRLASQKPHNVRNEQCRAEWWILWRRIAGGLSAGQQLTLAQPLLAALRSRLRPAGPIAQGKSSPFQYGPHESAEVWRLAGSLELLPMDQKVELGQTILELLPREKPSAVAAAALFALGRLGARVPVYGPLNGVLPADVVADWIDRLLRLNGKRSGQLPQVQFTLVQLARRTDDRYRDLPPSAIDAVTAFFNAHAAPGHFVELIRQGGQLQQEEQKLVFGESLPRGLSIG